MRRAQQQDGRAGVRRKRGRVDTGGPDVFLGALTHLSAALVALVCSAAPGGGADERCIQGPRCVSPPRHCTQALACSARLLLLLALLVLPADGMQCFRPEIVGNVTYHLWPHCRKNGRHDARYYINPGNYSCRAFNGAQLTVSRFEGDYKCYSTCPGGHYLGLGLGATRRVQRRDYTEAGAQGQELVCKQCPANTFSVGGGQLVHRWLPEITGKLPEDVQDGLEDIAADAPSTEKPEGSLPHEFTSTCYGFNTTAFQVTGSMTAAWVEGHLCEPWSPETRSRETHGLHLSSGNNRHVPKVRSELHLRLRMVRPGKVWFSFSVNVDEGPMAAAACPWLNGDTGNVGQWQCADGTFTNQSWGCNDHGGRHLCPSNFPRMCGQPNQCAGGMAYCCSVDCAPFGGPRLCPASGGLQVLLCRNLRVRRCQPTSILPLPFKDRFYVSSQLSWAWAYIDVPEGWAEIIFVYIRDGAVAGEDRALIGEVGWEGNKFSKVLYIVNLQGKYTRRSLTFENFEYTRPPLTFENFE